jgi:HAD superfamily hydrolase (TIGR01509 family)
MREEFLQIYAENICIDSRLFPGMEELLRHLEERDVAWGVVTNKFERLARPLMDALDLSDRAAVIVGGDTCPRPKPYPDPLLHAAAELSVAPARTLYVGDDKRDVTAARAAGMPVVVAGYGYLGDQTRPRSGAPMRCSNPPAPFCSGWSSAGSRAKRHSAFLPLSCERTGVRVSPWRPPSPASARFAWSVRDRTHEREKRVSQMLLDRRRPSGTRRSAASGLREVEGSDGSGGLRTALPPPCPTLPAGIMAGPNSKLMGATRFRREFGSTRGMPRVSNDLVNPIRQSSSCERRQLRSRGLIPAGLCSGLSQGPGWCCKATAESFT